MWIYHEITQDKLLAVVLFFFKFRNTRNECICNYNFYFHYACNIKLLCFIYLFCLQQKELMKEIDGYLKLGKLSFIRYYDSE